MVLHALPTLDETEVPDHAVTSAAHSSQATALELQHVTKMHCPAIPSILDGHRITGRGGMLRLFFLAQKEFLKCADRFGRPHPFAEKMILLINSANQILGR